MKRLISILILIAVLMTNVAFAEASQTNSEARIAELEEELAKLKQENDELKEEILKLKATIEELEKEPETPAPQYPTVQKGDKGADVQRVQQRLKDLNYLSGSVDGDFGNGTASAVKAFQSEAGLEATGIADEATQIALFADNAPKSKVYQPIDYKSIARDPDKHKGDLITFKGKIIQVMESGNYAVFRISSSGNYDDVVYCTFTIPDNYSRFLEDDRVTVYGVCTGIYTYETIMGGTVTIPSCTIDRIELR